MKIIKQYTKDIRLIDKGEYIYLMKGNNWLLKYIRKAYKTKSGILCSATKYLKSYHLLDERDELKELVKEKINKIHNTKWKKKKQ